jgi:hypothetical protein
LQSFNMLSNEVFALTCLEKYKAQGLVVNEKNGQFAHCPLPRGEGDSGYYLLFGDHQHQGLLQSRDLDKCCFFPGDTKSWLDGCTFCEGWSELYDIYDKYANEPGRKGAESTNREKDELGRSKNAVKGAIKTLELGIGIFRQTREEKAANGRKGAARSMERGVGVTARSPKKMSEDGRKGGKASAAQRWYSTVDGFESNAAGVTRHNKANGWDPGARVRIG